MANGSDGGVIIDVNLNVQETEKEISNVKNKIVKMEEEVGEKNARKTAIEEEMQKAGAAADAAKAKLDELIKERDRLNELGPQDGTEFLTAKSSIAALNDEIKQQQATADGLQKNFDKIYDSVEKYNTEINTTNAAIQYQKELYTELELKAAELHAQEAQAAAERQAQEEAARIAAEAAQAEKRAAEEAELAAAEQAAEIDAVRAQAEMDRAAAADRANEQYQAGVATMEQMTTKTGRARKELDKMPEAGNRTSKALEGVNKRLEKFEKRIVGLAKRVFVFSLISSALRKVRSYLWDVIQQDDQAMAAVARLKGALMTLAQPIVDYVIPAFTKLVNMLATAAQYAANVVAKLFGTTSTEAAARAAKNVEKESDSVKNLGKEAKKAQKSLAGFDEINRLTSENAEDATAATGKESKAVEPDFSGTIDQELGKIEALVGIALIAVGAILTFTGVNIPLGISLMAAGFLLMYAVIKENPNAIKDMLTGRLGVIFGIVSIAFLVVGSILTFTGVNLPLGIALMAMGAVGLASVVAINWDTIKNALQGPIGEIVGIGSALFLVIGAVLTFTGAAIPLGIGLMIAGAIGLAAVVAANWDTIVDALSGKVEEIIGIISAAILVLGLILVFTGVSPALGFGMIVAGAAGLAPVVAVNWDSIKEHLQNAWRGIVLWFNTKVKPFFTVEYWEEKLSSIGEGFKNAIKSGLNAGISIIEKGINWIVDKMNLLSFTVPDWVPAIGGSKFGFNIPRVSIPRLAQGAVIPANREFLAVLGDQKSGTNVEAPLETIMDAMRAVLAENGGGDLHLVVNVGGEKFVDTIVREINRKSRAAGASVIYV